jgi:hypothetical protein
MTFGFAALLLGALGGLGFPELFILLLLAGLLFRVLSGRKNATRFCAGCGHGLMQPADAPFCCYCGKRLG